ncbi:ABC transporter ATP-binding protein [Spirulina sp. 06S082]|uniref:energy-coupling factor ABC transporter ATP-binding protein n=1 Tax=Spirulina sp. 06S082 TaxID=3110248 RepID=UPI002B21D3F4|nr:ABC transporter ATP-binding protein [Spirulina sp. 06S082]MEA5470649.1 ABC transporter ATP-binding protein [Spirulina sp. 06S082]
MIQKTALTLTNLTFTYPDRPAIWQDLNLQIQPGERVGAIGPNGAGKTTLFLSICGILAPQNGQIDLFGQSVKTKEFRPEIGFVFQNPDDQLFCASVWDDVAFGVENMGLSPSEIKMRVQEALNLTGTFPLRDRIPHELSGGEKCMVAIASILAMRPQFILYDEPSANLDLSARRRLIKFIQQSRETILISSHDLELILEVCDRIFLLNQGTILADGKPKDILSDRTLMEANGLEVPYSLIAD